MFTRLSKCSGTTTLMFLLVANIPSATRAGGTSRFGIDYGVLRGVRIEMKDGRKLVGYVGWSSEDFKNEKEPKFPQSLLDPTAWVQETSLCSCTLGFIPSRRGCYGRHSQATI
jgi:hypothetical protein